MNNNFHLSFDKCVTVITIIEFLSLLVVVTDDVCVGRWVAIVFFLFKVVTCPLTCFEFRQMID